MTHTLYFADHLDLLPQLAKQFAGKIKLVYLDPPYNTRRQRGARKLYKDTRADWHTHIGRTLQLGFELLRDDGFLAVSINQMELFRLKAALDEVFGAERFIGLFPVKIRHVERQLMINATFHDVFEYLLIYRKTRATRFHTLHKMPDTGRFDYHIRLLDDQPEQRTINGKRVDIYQPQQYEIERIRNGETGLRRYVIAGKLATANWSGEWYENHLRALGDNLLTRVWGLEKNGLGYRWFQSGNAKRKSGVYFQSIHAAGRPILPSNDIDYTEVVPTIYREGGPGCDFKDSKKPEQLLAYLMEICTTPGDLVLDLYAGSGTTLAVAIKHDRQAIAVEQDPQALRIILNRLENLKAGLDVDGRAWIFDYQLLNAKGRPAKPPAA